MLRLAVSHALAGVLHLASAITLAVLSAGYDGTRKVFLLREVWTPQANHTDCSNVTCLVAPDVGEPYTFNLAAAAVFFGLWSGLLHLVAAYSIWDLSNDAVDTDKNVRFQLRRIRFYDYSVTASLMLACVSLVLGSPDLGQLISAASAQFGVIATFYFAQRAGAPWLGFAVSSVGYGLVWAPLFMVFQASSTSSTADPPDFVTYIIVGIFFQFTAFAFIQAWILWKKTAFALEEALFLSASLTAKVLLHWVLFLAAISYNEITSTEATGDPSSEASQEVLSVVIGTLGGGLVLSLVVTYPAWACGSDTTLYG